MWLTLPFYDFCGFRSVAVNTVYKLQFFYIYCGNHTLPDEWTKELMNVQTNGQMKQPIVDWRRHNKRCVMCALSFRRHAGVDCGAFLARKPKDDSDEATTCEKMATVLRLNG